MAFTEASLRTLRFHGPLIAEFGRDFKYRAHSATKMISAAKNLLPNFEHYMLSAHKRGLTFAVFVGKRNIKEDELELTKGTDDIHLVPVIIGSKRAGFFQTILGVALIGAATFFSGGTLAGAFASTGVWGGALALTGASMALGGVVQMLSPQQAGIRMRQDPDNKPSYAFGGPVNSTAQGNPVAIGYGEREIGGAVISAGIYTEDQQ
ncbi:tail assembly protein [Obesumbacterium proteus]|uniref:tail assembly protein n=1 Tax=Obesumbacterium proteus TaxID=82983 RepID=UPI001F1CED6C|nr:tail assembly protein [Obesumbacterium proteus]MCE9886804.1 tail assembly protein [Obesumbacterium proteus]MCE9918131.1 tail assembly protein [Obesumbacterium proteus]MCG2875264.1 tail assembly protein [Obesumbacterium proteus]